MLSFADECLRKLTFLCRLLTTTTGRNEQYEAGFFGKFLKQAALNQALRFMMVCRQVNVYNLTNLFIEVIARPLNLDLEILSLFWHQKRQNYCDRACSHFDDT